MPILLNIIEPVNTDKAESFSFKDCLTAILSEDTETREILDLELSRFETFFNNQEAAAL